jgi:Zn-dependent membrane protease YugP
MGSMGYFAIVGVFALIGRLVSGRLKSKFAQYCKMPTPNGMTGADIAQKMLEDYGIHDVKISMGQGMLSDHYNPLKKEVKLSPDVYQGRHVSAAAVAAHEVGHAVQHAKAYPFLGMRSAIVPFVQASSKVQGILFGVGIYFMSTSSPIFLIAAIATFGITAFFSLVTLPVEFDASNRALDWLNSSKILPEREHTGAKDALKWAAMTYVVGALSAVVQVLYWGLMFMNNRNRA